MNKPLGIGSAKARTPRLIVVVILLILVGRVLTADAQTETNLYTFLGSPNDGNQPYAGLIQGRDGNFYGTTYNGGTNNHGIVFRITPGGIETNLHTFGDGSVNFANGLVQGSDGNFYGTTYQGGTNSLGSVFRITPAGIYTNLHSFGSSPTDGARPFAALVQGSDSNLYGTTTIGGASSAGTVFRISPAGNYTNLYSFANFPTDGANPEAALIQASDGNFYGTTIAGGTIGFGTVFRINPAGSETNLYSFGGSATDGNGPTAALVQGSDGNFYGTAEQGGANHDGTLFRISPAGNYTNLYSFGSSPGDGNFPGAGLLQGSDGNFYGTTEQAGANGVGTVFRISPGGNYTNLYSFSNSASDGHQPHAALIQGIDGKFYGTTTTGGSNSVGIVFRLTVPLNPPANQISAVQLAGTNAVLSIPSVATEIYQLQFSSAMAPTNWINQGGSITSSGSLLTVTNLGGALLPQGFYRFDITP
ncbi:MAG TPA: choice-of-anchor tandem repeat GloVer-containing protein [Verrucomicrobiae bacterium]|nr:choice-of-anchor tandem repeat GloVer-containing protein [Verrucomicrobiae bacterium]